MTELKENSLNELLQNSHDFKKINPSLDNIKKALELFSRPDKDFKSIIVAGTNGKGSVCSFLEQLYLKYTNVKIAKFISPHLISPTERIRVNNQDISESDLSQILQEINSKLDFELSYFEKLALVSHIYFSRQEVDIAIIEVGMGGRWDCANAIDDEDRIATVISSIALDHMEFLGDTVEKIRIEKEAIKRESVPHFDYKDFHFKGSVDQRNFLLAKEVFLSFNKDVQVNEAEIMKAFYESYKARFQYLEAKNLFIDSAHNIQAAKELSDYILSRFPGEEIELHMAFLDRDYEQFVKPIFSKLKISKLFLYQLDNERAVDVNKVYETFKKLDLDFDIEISSLDKLNTASSNLKLVTGSIYFSGSVLKLIS